MASPATRWLLSACDPDRAPAPPTVPLSLSDWQYVLDRAERHGVAPIVLHHLETLLTGGAPLAPSGAAGHEELRTLAAARRRSLLATAGLTLLLRKHSEKLLDALAEANIPALGLKGPDFADRLYPQPAWRTFCDVDLLTRKSDLPAARDVLARLGYRPGAPQGGKHDGGYGEETWNHIGLPGVAVELHWNLVNGPSLQRTVSVTFDDLPREPVPGRAGWQRPTATGLLLLAAVHAAVGHQFDRLQLLNDLRQACRGAAGPIDPLELAERAAETGARRAVQVALDLVARTLDDGDARLVLEAAFGGDTLPIWRRLVSSRTVLAAGTRLGSLRRQALREALKRAA